MPLYIVLTESNINNNGSIRMKSTRLFMLLGITLTLSSTQANADFFGSIKDKLKDKTKKEAVKEVKKQTNKTAKTTKSV